MTRIPPVGQAGRGWAGLAAGFPPRSTWWRAGAAARWPDHHAGPARGLPAVHPADGPAHIARRGQGRPRTRPGAALADKAYSSAANRACLRKRGIKAVIPVKEDQKAHRRRRGRSGGRPPAFDRTQDKDRNSAERCFTKLKQHRAVATRYDKRERIYQRHHRRCVNQELAPRPGPMIHGTGRRAGEAGPSSARTWPGPVRHHIGTRVRSSSRGDAAAWPAGRR